MRTLTAGELHILGRYLYGARWQTALAGELGVNPRMVVYWASARRPICPRRSAQIVELARARCLRRVTAEQRGYAAMAAAMPTPAVQVGLLVGPAL